MTTPVQGPPGLSAYQIAVLHGFVGTEAQWVASLKGQRGLTGATGPTGPQGAAGPRGYTGPTGPAGARGAVGPAGPTGLTGAKGNTGAQGATGPTGPRGAVGPAGPRGGAGPTGATGPAGPAGARGLQGLPTTVNGHTGTEITLNAADVGALTQSTADTRYLQAAAAATQFVGMTGNQTIAGIKTFSSTPQVPGGKVTPLDWFNVKTYGAVGDGTTNDKVALQTAIDAAKAVGGGVVYLPKGTYRIGSPLTLTAATGVQIVGAGWVTTIKVGDGVNDYALKFDGSDTRVRIADLTIDGNCTNQTSGGGVYGIGAVQCLFQNVHFTACYDYALLLGAQTGGAFGHNNKITNCLFDNAMGSAGIGGGIYMTSNDENVILGCDFEYLGGAGTGPVGILDKAGTQFISSCNFVNGGHGAIGVRVQDCTATRITGCNFDGTSGDSIFLAASRCNVVGNTIFSPGISGTAGTASGIHLEYAANYNVVNSNTISSAPGAGVTRSLIREEAIGDAGANSIQDNTLITDGALSVGVLDCAGPNTILRGNIGAGPTGDAGFLTQTAGDSRYIASSAASGFVATTGTQNVGGVKTFTQTPQVPGGRVSSVNWYNVKAYGAAGNGTTDDTTSIQSAINAANAVGGGTVYLPTGTYKISSALTLYNHINLLGDGDYVTNIVQSSTTANGLEGSSLIYVTIKALRLTGPGSGSGQGIKFTTEFDYCILEDISTVSWGSTGIEIEQPIVSNFTRVMSRLNGGAGFYIHGTGLGAGTSISMNSCWATDNVSNGYSFYNMTYCALVGCAADNQINAGKAGYLVDTCVGFSFIGCGSENNNIGVKFTGGGTHSVSSFFNYANPSTGIGFWVTGSSTNNHLTAINETSPSGSASRWVQVDTGSSATVRGSIHSTADQFAAGTTVSISNLSGVEAVAGSRATGQNMLVGSTTPLGDNGVGELALADATTVPSTNPTGGLVLYSKGGQLNWRDPSGIIRQPVNWLSAAGYGAKGDGSTDDTAAIQAAITALGSGGGTVYLGPGTYLLNGSVGLSLSATGVVLRGAGQEATKISIGSGFTAATAISITGSNSMVTDLSIIGANATTTSNPVANGVNITGCRRVRVDNVMFWNINGWCVKAAADATASGNPDGTMLTRITTRQCAGGIYFLGNTASGYAVNSFVSDVHMIQNGTATGGSANLDNIRVEDAWDVLVENALVWMRDGTGSCLHITGNCAATFVQNLDTLGPNTTQTSPSVLIEDGTNGSPQNVQITGGVIQQGLTGVTISGAASQIRINQSRIMNNKTHGVVVSGTANTIYLNDCFFTLNGSGASGTNYDINWSGTAVGLVSNCRFGTAITASGVAGVQFSVNVAASQGVRFDAVIFGGTGASSTNWFTNRPSAAMHMSSGVFEFLSDVNFTWSGPGRVALQPSTSTNNVLSTNVGGSDAFDRFRLLGTGSQQFGTGASARDTTWQRMNTAQIGTPDSDVVIGLAGKGLFVKEGTGAKQGTITMNGTTSVVVSNASITATSRIQLTCQNPNGTVVGVPYVVSRVAGTSFTVASTASTDLSTVAYLITEAA